MSFAVMSALSLVCMDAALAARPLPAVAETEIIVAQAEETKPADDLTPQPADDLDDAKVKIAPREFVSDEEEYAGPLAFGDKSDEEVVALLIDYLEGVDTLQGDFTQIAPSGAVSNGRFYLRRPGFLRFEYDPPTPLLIVANGGMVYVRDEALETTDSYPVGKTPLKFLLRKEVDLDDAKAIAVDRGVDSVAVTFASQKEETEGELTIIVNAPDMSLRRWIVRDVQKGITVVNLENVEEGVRLANRLFETPEAGGQFLKN